jgi:hypothetical protein
VASDDNNNKKSAYVFQSGDIAAVSGLYRTDYCNCGTPPELHIVKGQRFPVCPQCGETANFLLEREFDPLQKTGLQ